MANTKSILLDESSNQFLSITNANQTGLNTGDDITLECWIKPSSETGTLQTIYNKDTSVSNQRGFQVFLVEDTGTNEYKVRVDISNNGTDQGQYTTSVATTLNTTTWYHLAVTFDGSENELKVFIDSSQLGTTITTSESTIYSNTATVNIGVWRDQTQLGYDGRIDEMIVWDDARTSTEISESYNSGNGKVYVGNEANMQGYWRFEDDLTDETSNGNDLTNNNSATFSTDVPFTGGGGSPYTLVVDTMAVASTFNAVVLSHARKLVVATMAVATTFNDVVLTKSFAGLTLVVDTMAVAVTNNAVTLRKAYKAIFNTMAVTSTFNAVNFAWTRAYSLVVDTMSIISTFFDVSLRIPGRWVNKTKNTSTWTNLTKN